MTLLRIVAAFQRGLRHPGVRRWRHMDACSLDLGFVLARFSIVSVSF
jgi:hypothetical protein